MSYGFLMVGNAVSNAIRTGEWAWASALLDEWLANEITGDFYLELYVDRAVLTALTGGDAEADLAAGRAAAAGIVEADPQYRSYIHWGRAWQAFTAGGYRGRREGRSGGRGHDLLQPISLPLAARAALWSGDVAEARAIADRLDASVVRGQAFGLDRATLRAGIAALEGRRATRSPATATCCAAGASSGCAFDEALAVLDLAILLAPTEREMSEARATIDERARDAQPTPGAAPPRSTRGRSDGSGARPT